MRVDRPSPGEVALIKKILAGGGTALDVGANVGLFSILMAGTSSDVIVHAFEPISRTFNFLEKNTADFDNIHCHRMAIADVTASVYMTCAEAGFTMNRIVECNEGEPREMVESTTIDRFYEENRIRTVKLLKIDIEGAEVRAFKGMRSVKPDAIILEVAPNNLAAMGHKLEDLYGEVCSLGYRFYTIGDDGTAGECLSLTHLKRIKLANVMLASG